MKNLEREIERLRRRLNLEIKWRSKSARRRWGILPTIQEEGRAESVFEERVGDFETKGEIGELFSKGGSSIANNFGKYGGPNQSFRTAGGGADERALGGAAMGRGAMS